MKIGEVVRQTGASQKAIRHYENIGLLTEIQRMGSYRRYSQQDINRIRLIRTAQQMGFRLSELVNCVDDGGLPSWQKVVQLIEQKQAALQHQILQLQTLNAQLELLRQTLCACLGPDEDPMDLLDVECEWLVGQPMPGA